MQIRTRLTIQFIVSVAAILLLALGYIYVNYAHSLKDEFYRGLRSKAMLMAETILRRREQIQLEVNSRTSDAERLPVSGAISIYDQDFKNIFSINPPAEGLSHQTLQDIWDQGECRFEYGNLPAIGIRHNQAYYGEFIVIAAANYDNADLINLRNILVVAFLVVLGIVTLAGWFFAGLAMAPVSRIINEVDQILPTHLNVRLKENKNKDEIGRLIQTFNQMLDRMSLAFKMQRQFVSNVSHELKNPISVISSQLEIALARNRPSEEYISTIQSVLEDVHGLSTMTDRLLQMARIHSENESVPFTRVKLDDVVIQAQHYLKKQKPNYTIAFQISGEFDDEAAFYVYANEALLRVALLNLMENGCKFSPNHHVDVILTIHPEKLTQVEISDSGPGIPASDLPLVFQPFYRGAQQAKIAGTGIGLSLVDSILQLHKIAISVHSQPNSGTIFTLTFPPNP